MSHPFRLLLGLFTLLAAFALQFWLVLFGIHADLAFAALVAFAFIFDIWELAAFVLFAAFVVNWQPTLSVDIAAFALIPLAVYGIRRWLHADLWIGRLISAVASLFALYLLIAPAAFASSFPSFLLDVVICLVVGQIIIWGLGEMS